MKNQSILFIGLIAVLTGAVVGYAIWGAADGKYTTQMSHEDMMTPAGMHRMPDGSLMENTPSESSMEMMGGMDHSAMMVTSERAFLEGMLPHHQEAVDTAREVIARGGSTPEILKLAEDIVLAQEKEIALMKGWYQDWYGQTYQANPETYSPMMRDLSSLTGADLDRVFLEDMIMHHMGAVMMAQSVQPYIEHQEIADLSKAIIATQTVEIQLMRRLINEL